MTILIMSASCSSSPASSAMTPTRFQLRTMRV